MRARPTPPLCREPPRSAAPGAASSPPPAPPAGVAPGPIGGTAGMTKLAPGRVEEIGKEVPIGRLGRTQDIALACVFLVR